MKTNLWEGAQIQQLRELAWSFLRRCVALGNIEFIALQIGEGPEVRRGRKNLFDVVQHKCVEGLQQNPHFTGACQILRTAQKLRHFVDLCR